MLHDQIIHYNYFLVRRVDSVSDLFCASASHLKMYTLNEEAIRFNKDIQSKKMKSRNMI